MPYQNTPETLKRAAQHVAENKRKASINGTYTDQPEDTTGLGEYSTRQLLQELLNRVSRGK